MDKSIVYIKEAWATEKQYDNLKPRDIPLDAIIYYLLDGYDSSKMGKKRSPLFLPERFARYFIKITGVRAEKLNCITDTECEKEGLDNPCGYYCDVSVGHVDHQGTINNFAKLWSINKDYPWESNPYVWRYEFIGVEE